MATLGSSGTYVPSRQTYHAGLLNCEIALLVEVDGAEDGVELVLAQRRNHRLELQRAGFLGRLRPRLDGGISVKGVTLWLETGRSKPLDDGRCCGASARVGVISEDRSYGRGTGNEAKLFGPQIGTSYQLNPVAAVACETCHEPDLGVVSANERHGDIGRLKLSDLGCVIGPAGDVGLVDCFAQAPTIELLLGLLGDKLPKGRVVVEDRDVLVGPMIGQKVPDRPTDRIVAVLDAKDVGTPQLGQHWVAR